MKVKLVVVSGKAAAAEFELRVPAVIGRGKDVSLTLPHDLVSRHHCEIFVDDDGRLFLRDLGSLNGTRLNDARIEQPVPLSAGDRLTLGEVSFRVTPLPQSGDPLESSGSGLFEPDHLTDYDFGGSLSDSRLPDTRLPDAAEDSHDSSP